jgi:hypothetical protein
MIKTTFVSHYLSDSLPKLYEAKLIFKIPTS